MGLIRFRCSDDLEARFEAAAKKADMKPAQAARAVFEKVFPASTTATRDDLANGEKEYQPRSTKLTTRLTEGENEALGKRAKALGMGKPTYVTRLIRGHLTNRPQLSPDEVNALRETTRELSYIGRNLNQVAHALHINLNAREKASAELIAEINEKIDAIRKDIKDVLDENINRWGV